MFLVSTRVKTAWDGVGTLSHNLERCGIGRESASTSLQDWPRESVTFKFETLTGENKGQQRTEVLRRTEVLFLCEIVWNINTRQQCESV